MVTICKKAGLWILLICMLAALNGCRQNPTEEELFAKLVDHFVSRGYTCRIEAVPEEQNVPIYKASAWRRLMLDDEEVLVYFDESNRADYLLDGIDQTPYTYAGRMRLRFLVLYEGQDPGVLDALAQLPAD